MSDQNPLAKSLQLLWNGLPESTKGPKPKLSLEKVVEAGIALADAEGIEALSMRSLAKELGVGTMSLYRYVPSKTELLNLMLDTVTEPTAEVQQAAQQGWRTSLEAGAWTSRRLYLEHQWMLQANWSRPVMGPHSVAGLDYGMRGLRGTGLSDQEKMGVISAVDSFVMGTARQEVLWQAAAEESGLSDEEFWTYQLPFLETAMNSGRFPTMAELSEDTFDASWEESFRMGLDLLLDGLELTINRRGDLQHISRNP